MEKNNNRKMEEIIARDSLDSFWLDDMMDFFAADYGTDITEEMKKEFHEIFTTPFAANGNIFTGKEGF